LGHPLLGHRALGIQFERQTAARMAPYFLSRLDRFTVCLEHGCQCASERTPPDMLADASAHSSRADAFLKQTAWPIELPPLLFGAAENVVRVLVKRVSSAPFEQNARKPCVHRRRLLDRFGLEEIPARLF